MASTTHVERDELERQLVHRIFVAVAIAVPVSIVFWMGVLWLSVGLSGVTMAGAVAMGAGVGVLAGIFWGAWVGFAFFSHTLDEHERDRPVTDETRP
jgi:hypothetical protein